jgi:hypothetical protein
MMALTTNGSTYFAIIVEVVRINCFFGSSIEEFAKFKYDL